MGLIVRFLERIESRRGKFCVPQELGLVGLECFIRDAADSRLDYSVANKERPGGRSGHRESRRHARRAHLLDRSDRDVEAVGCGVSDFGLDPRVLLPENALTNEVVLDMFRSEVPAEML
jgi:hypothetical protein